MKKGLFLSGAVIGLVSLFVSCGSPLDGKKDFDHEYYNIGMGEAISASKDFVNNSVKSSVTASRAAFVELSDDDKWQGYIDGMWNVPSNVYGTDEYSANNQLVINGEDLGTLQELYFHKDEAGNFRKGIFEYKGNFYYVLDKETLTNKESDSYVILAASDGLDKVVVDQKDYFDNPEKSFIREDFSNFKIWIWEDNGENRRGNLGYAYTLRNIRMLDGSYATVTVSGYNYYNYGFRVWIKETAAPTVTNKEIYELENHIKNGTEDYDFIYELKNTTDKTLYFQNYLADCIDQGNYNNLSIGKRRKVMPNEEVQLKYSITDLRKTFPAKNLVMGAFFYDDEQRCLGGGWENGINSQVKNRIHIVTAHWKSDNNDVDFDNSEEQILAIPEEGVITLSLKNCAEQLKNVSYIDIERKEHTSENWSSVMNYMGSDNRSVETDVEIKDYYTDAGKTYDYRIAYWGEDSQEYLDLGTHTASAGLGEMKIKPGKATFNNETKALEFSELPELIPPINVGRDTSYNIQYTGNNSHWNLIFYLFREKDGVITLEQALEDSGSELKNDTEFTISCYEFRNGINIGENSWLNYHIIMEIDPNDTELPITIRK